MSNQYIEEAIFAACFAEPRDFTKEEKQYILNSASEGGGSPERMVITYSNETS